MAVNGNGEQVVIGTKEGGYAPRLYVDYTVYPTDAFSDGTYWKTIDDVDIYNRTFSGYEDFRTYIEVDPNGDLSVSSDGYTCTVSNHHYNEDMTYLYKYDAVPDGYSEDFYFYYAFFIEYTESGSDYVTLMENVRLTDQSATTIYSYSRGYDFPTNNMYFTSGGAYYNSYYGVSGVTRWYRFNYEGSYIWNYSVYSNEQDCIDMTDALNTRDDCDFTLYGHLTEDESLDVMVNRDFIAGATYNINPSIISYLHISSNNYTIEDIFYLVENGTLIETIEGYDDLLDYFDIEELEVGYIEDSFYIDSDDDEWLFMGEIYDITAQFYNPEYAEISFNDGIHETKLKYLNSTKKMNVESTDSYVCGLIYSTYEIDNGTYTLKWRAILDKNIVDSYNVSFDYYTYNDYDESFGSTGTYRNIYNLGGKVYYNFTGDAGRIIGGEPFQVYVNQTGSIASTSAVFRKLQHWRMLYELDFSPTWNVNYYTNYIGTAITRIGFDYRIDNEWVDGWYCLIYLNEGNIGHYGGSNDNSWIKLNVEWYNNGTMVKEDYIYTYSYAYFPSGQSASERTTFNVWVDIWFNRLNASTVVGGRVNSYYHGMEENGWWLWTDFAPKMGNVTSSMFFDDLLDVNGSIVSCKDIELVRPKLILTKTTYDNRVEVYPFEIMDWKQADDRMEGVNTPVFTDTKVIDMPQTGFIASLISAVQGISTSIWKGALGFIHILISSMDSLLTSIGSPVSMSQMIEWIMVQTSVISSWMIYVTEYALSMITVFTSMLNFVLQIMENMINAILWIFGNVVAFPLHIMNFIVAIINGQTYTINDWVFDFTTASELIDSAKTLAPLTIGFGYVSWLFWGNIDMTGDVDEAGIAKRILLTFQYMREGYNSIFWVFNRMRNEIVSLYNFIRSHIGGGGGGEVSET